jgi:hypothetical protein
MIGPEDQPPLSDSDRIDCLLRKIAELSEAQARILKLVEEIAQGLGVSIA